MRRIPDFCCAIGLRGEFDEEVLRESGVFSWKGKAVVSPQPSALSKTQGPSTPLGMTGAETGTH